MLTTMWLALVRHGKFKRLYRFQLTGPIARSLVLVTSGDGNLIYTSIVITKSVIEDL